MEGLGAMDRSCNRGNSSQRGGQNVCSESIPTCDRELTGSSSLVVLRAQLHEAVAVTPGVTLK